MQLITANDKARSAVMDYRRTHFDEGRGQWRSSHHRDTFERLLAANPTPEAVEAIQPGLTKLRCDECDEMFDCIIEVGEPPDYESRTAQLCGGCMREAADLMGLFEE